MNFFFSKYLVDIDSFEMDKTPVGHGQFGVVYKALRKKDPKHPKRPEILCAVKQLKTDEIRTKEDQEKFHKEVGCQANLKHIGVLPLIGYTIPLMSKGMHTVITEFMPNGSLLKLIEKVAAGNAPENWETIKAINIFGIAAAMAYVHQHKVIHRDLKTENIMLDKDFYPKIADFGLSKIFEEGTQDHINQTLEVGTPTYMAPELLEDPHYTNKVDVFAYSIILYELITNNKPWSDKKNLTKFSLFRYVQQGERPTIHDREIPDDYVELIERCWDKDPKRRPSFIRIVKGFMENKDVYFDSLMIDQEIFDDYIDEAIRDLDFSKAEEDVE